MVYYLIVCRSLTYAQRGVRLLERAGISAYLVRAPRLIAQAGCAYCIKVSQRWLERSVELLRGAGLVLRGVYRQMEDGSYEEVSV